MKETNVERLYRLEKELAEVRESIEAEAETLPKRGDKFKIGQSTYIVAALGLYKYVLINIDSGIKLSEVGCIDTIRDQLARNPDFVKVV